MRCHAIMCRHSVSMSALIQKPKLMLCVLRHICNIAVSYPAGLGDEAGETAEAEFQLERPRCLSLALAMQNSALRLQLPPA